MPEVDCGMKATGSQSNQNTSSRGVLGYESYHRTRKPLAIPRLSSQFEPGWKSTKTRSTFPKSPGQTSQPSRLKCFWYWSFRTRTIISSSGTFPIRDTRHLRASDIPSVQSSTTQKTHPFRYTSTSRISLQFWYSYTSCFSRLWAYVFYSLRRLPSFSDSFPSSLGSSTRTPSNPPTSPLLDRYPRH